MNDVAQKYLLIDQTTHIEGNAFQASSTIYFVFMDDPALAPMVLRKPPLEHTANASVR